MLADGTTSAFASNLKVAGLVCDTNGSLYASDYYSTVYKLTPDGARSVFANTGMDHPFGMALDSQGSLYVANWWSTNITKYASDGTYLGVFASGWWSPAGLAFAPEQPATQMQIAAQPQSQIVGAGSASSFTITLTGGVPPYGYQWQKEGVAISGATNSALSLTNVQMADAGIYSVLVHDASTNAMTSQPASLTIRLQDTDIMALSNNAYLINLDSRRCGWPPPWGAGTLVMMTLGAGTWKVEPTNYELDSRALYMASSLFSGSYWTAFMQVMDMETFVQAGKSGGAYDCHYTTARAAYYDDPENISFAFNASHSTLFAFYTGDTYLSDNSGGVSVILTREGDAFQITQQPQPRLAYWGKEASFSVVATNGSLPYRYQWQHGGVAISGATNSLLVLTNLQTADAGDYTAIVTDARGYALTSQPATLTVNPAGVNIALYAGVTIDGVVGQTYGVQSTLDLSNTNSWVGRANVTLTNTTQVWYDSQPATLPQTSYRVVPGPITIP